MYGSYRGRRAYRPYGKRTAKSPAAKFVRKTVSTMMRAAGVSKPEIRHNWFELIGGTVGNTLSVAGQPLGPTVQGADEGQVVGMEYNAQKIRGRLVFQNTSITNALLVRVLIVEDRAGALASLVPYNNAASYGYLLYQSGNAFSLIRPDVRYRVMHDSTRAVPAAGSGATNVVHHEFSIDLGNAYVRNEHPVAASTLYTTNRNYMLWVLSDTGGLIAFSTFIDFQYTDA